MLQMLQVLQVLQMLQMLQVLQMLQMLQVLEMFQVLKMLQVLQALEMEPPFAAQWRFKEDARLCTTEFNRENEARLITQKRPRVQAPRIERLDCPSAHLG